MRCTGDAYRYTIQPIYDNLTDSVTCHIRRRRSSPVLFNLFYFVEVTARGFRSPVVRRRVRADAFNEADAGRRGSVAVDYLHVEFNVGVDLADDFLLRATGLAAAQEAGGDRTVTGTVRNVPKSVDEDHGGPMRFRVHEIAQSAAFVASIRPRKPFDVSTARWRHASLGAADAGAASCDMSTSKFLPADDVDDDDYRRQHDQRRQLQAVKAVIQGRPARDRAFRYYIMSIDSAPYFRFTIPGQYRPAATCRIDVLLIVCTKFVSCRELQSIRMKLR